MNVFVNDGWCVIDIFLKERALASHLRVTPLLVLMVSSRPRSNHHRSNHHSSRAMKATDSRDPNPRPGERSDFCRSHILSLINDNK